MVIASIILLTIAIHALLYGDILMKLRYLIIFLFAYFILHIIFVSEGSDGMTPSFLLIITFILTLPLIVYYLYSKAVHSGIKYISYIIATICYYFSVSYVFNNVMQLHQRKRVLDLLGVESDIFGWGYNVNQSKIAIGSGGMWGKGFLHGTQTKFNFVPEQSTDFIFCTVGEEFGFIGSVVVVLLFAILILRLMYIGDKIFNSYSRIYCYCAASIILFHVVINIGMTIGIVPVIGIPLPFFSYGGSSLLAFTIMLSIALKLNMDNFEKK